jgi:signal transduction histidine kinase
MGIRKRLVTLSVGIAVPLTLVGLAMTWGLWQESRRQLDDSIGKQSELAAVAFERWVDGQRQPLAALAAHAAQNRQPPYSFADSLPFIVKTRPHWIDLRILDAEGHTVVAEPANAAPLKQEFVSTILSEVRRRSGWAVVTDWTRGEGRPVISIAVPVDGGGSVIARIDGAAMGAIFSEIELSENAVIIVFDSQRRVLYRSTALKENLGDDRSDSPLFVPLTDKPSAVVEATSPYDGIRRIYGLVRVGSTDCVVAVGAPTGTLYRPARRQLLFYSLFSLVALASALAAALLIARRITSPVFRLREAAQRFGAGDLSARASAEGGGELEELATVFNDMAEEIEKRTERLTELDRLKSEFVGGVSHELRTPLTTIKTLTRVLLRGEEDAERREHLEAIAAECDRQIDLVLNLLDLSRIEAGAFEVSRARVDVAEVVRSCVQVSRHSAEARGHTLSAELPDGLPRVFSDPAALRRVLCGLVENAIKYTPDGGRITLAAHPAGAEVAVVVADTGCGIRAEDIPHVFEKFYRGRPAAARGRNSVGGGAAPRAGVPGVGLGLYLARTIIERLGGSISVESVAGHGSIFTVRLPAWEGEDEVGEEASHAEAVARG